jgi:DNA-binding NarL/FixJ family response regulator
VRLLIADNAPTRLGITMALGTEVCICAEASDAEQAIRAAKREQPDVCLVGREDLLECVRAGAIGYVPGALNAERLRRIIRAVAANEAVIPRSMILELLLELRGGGGGADVLTAREAQVLRMLRRGHTTAEIAQRLHIAPVTVRRHISELVHKLGVEDRSALTGPGRWWWAQPEAAAQATAP